MMTPEQFEQAISVVRYHFREVGELEEEILLHVLISAGLSPVTYDEIIEVVHAAAKQAKFYADHGVLPQPSLDSPAMGRC